VPLASLHRALKSAQHASSASIRLTKKDDKPWLSVTIQVPSALTHRPRQNLSFSGNTDDDPFAGTAPFGSAADTHSAPSGRETTITQDVPCKVLAAAAVEGIHEPRCPDPEVHILLPPLLQLKTVSERFTRLAITSKKSSTGGSAGASSLSGPKLEIAANMHGELKVAIRAESFQVQSCWRGLTNPELDPEMIEGGREGLANHPSTRMKEAQGDEGWAVVRVEGRDWGRVLGVGRMGGRVVACE
jgi:HUS1 checkpoint protein